MTLLTEARLILRIWYYELAQRQMHPAHPDVPHITLMLHWLHEQRRQRMSHQLGERA
jgi:hypothetical protein